MFTKLARENHRLVGLSLFIITLLSLSFFFIMPVGAQRPYSYEGYLRTIARFRTDVAFIDSPEDCIETVEAIAAELEQITVIEMPDRTLMTVEHQGVADALRERPCSREKADQYLSGLCPERMCPASRPVPPVRGLEGDGEGTGGSLVGVGGGSGGGAAPPPDGGPSMPGPGDGGQQAPDPDDGFGSGDEDGGGSDNGGDGNNAGGNESDPNGPEANLPGGPGGNGEPTPTPSPTPSPTPTPTPTPTPEPAAAAEEDEEQTGLSPWIIVIVAMALVFIIGAVALLFWPSDEEEMERKKKRKMAGAAMSEGRKMVEEGDYREAVRRLFLATLLTLDEKGVIRFDTTQTNYELLAQERIRPSLIPALSPVIGAYERVWYGLQPLPTREYDLLVKKIREIRDFQVEPDEPTLPGSKAQPGDGIS